VETGVGGVYTQFVYSPSGGKLAVVQGGALVKATIPLPGGETAVYNASGLNFIRHKDWLGSSRLATTWAHGVYSKESYAPFGETYNEAGTPDRSFTGQDQDTTGGVYDFLFRKYDPAAGRWLSPDPLGWGAVTQEVPQSLNRYAYVQNNPNSLIDPNGLECVWDNGSYDSADDVSTGSVDGCTGQGGTWVDPSVFEAVEGNQYGSWSGQASSSVAFDWTTPSVIVNGDISGAASAYETIGQSFLPMSTPQSGGNAHNNGQNPNGTIAQGHPKASFWTNLGETLGCLAGMDPNYVGPSTTRDSTPRDPLNSTKGTSGSRGGTPIPDAINQASSITQCLINVSKE
jgi:RHS repeat-associated protein